MRSYYPSTRNLRRARSSTREASRDASFFDGPSPAPAQEVVPSGQAPRTITLNIGGNRFNKGDYWKQLERLEREVQDAVRETLQDLGKVPGLRAGLAMGAALGAYHVWRQYFDPNRPRGGQRLPWPGGGFTLERECVGGLWGEFLPEGGDNRIFDSLNASSPGDGYSAQVYPYTLPVAIGGTYVVPQGEQAFRTAQKPGALWYTHHLHEYWWRPSSMLSVPHRANAPRSAAVANRPDIQLGSNFKVSPYALPSMFTALQPFEQMARLDPVPKSLQEAMHELSLRTDTGVSRRVEYPPLPVLPAPQLRTSPYTSTAVLQGPRGQAVDLVLSQPRGPTGRGPARVSTRPTDHRWSKPRPGKREAKVMANNRAAALLVFGAVTEFGDFVGAIHDALPKEARRSRTWRDKDGKWHRARIDSQLRDIYANLDKVDWYEALVNLVANEVEDRLIGKVNRQANKLTRQLGDRYLGQGVGTRISHILDTAQGSPVQIISDVVDTVADAIKSGPSNLRRL